MKTEELVQLLAQGVEPVDPRPRARRTALALGVATAVAVVMTATLIGLRQLAPGDLGSATYWGRESFCAALAVGGFLVAGRLARPGATLGLAPGLVAVTLAAMWAAALAALWSAPPGGRIPLLLGQTALACPFLIAMVSAPLLAAYTWMMREMAPTRLRLAGAAAGFAAGAAGALVYTLHCPELAAPFLGVWYVLGILIPTALGAVFGPRVLRW